jgi:hypothetical protein
VQVPLTLALLREIEQYQLRSSCQHCLFFLAASQGCGHGWPNQEQRQWPLTDAAEAPFCKEFELR